MSLSADELQFLRQREQLTRWWPPVGIALLAVLAGTATLLAWRAPLLANPYVALQRIAADDVEPATLALAAMMASVLTWTVFLLLFAVVMFTFAAMKNERRTLALIRRLHAVGNAKVEMSSAPPRTGA